VLKEGDTLKAGSTEIVVMIDRARVGPPALPPPAPPAPPTPEEVAADDTVGFARPSAESLVVAGLEASDGEIFAVVDTARDPAIIELLRKNGELVEELYTGPRGERLTSATPHIASVRRGSRLLRRLVRHGWGKGWGMYVLSDRPFASIRDHLRGLLVIPTGAGEGLSFRFFDPSILRSFLPSLSPEQARCFFGPVASIALEAQGSRLILRFAAPAAVVTAEGAGDAEAALGAVLTLDRAQIEALDRAQIELFIDRMEGVLRRDYARELSAWAAGGADLRGAICDGMTRAAGYGVEREEDIERYIKLMAILGPKFDEDATLPWAGEILRRKVVGSPRKLDALKEHLAARYGRTV